jgi:CRISPR-associated protein Cas1
MNPLLVTGFGTTIKVDKRKLIIDNHRSGDHQEFLPHQISYDSIIIDGHTGNISFEAMRWIAKHDIALILLNWNGNLLSNCTVKEPKNGKLRINQYAKYMDNKTRYEIASKIVDEKINKSYNLLSELSKYYEELDIEAIEKTFSNEKNFYESMLKKDKGRYDFNQLLMYEGKIALVYWNNLRLIFNKLYPNFNFQGRRNKSYSWNMNASEEINALLNYGYAILESKNRKYINTIGLDLSVGFLHELAQSKTPLVYDLQELYRWIVDLSIIELLEEKKLKKTDFIVTENYNIRLEEDTAKMLIEKIQGNFNSKVSYKRKNYTYESIMLDNIQGLANFVIGKSDKLRFEIPSIEINRNDDKDIRDLLLKMTPDERKNLGINRNTLWYIKKNLKEGKKIELYDKVKRKIIS